MNPFFRARLPILRDLLDGQLPHLQAPQREGSRSVAFPLDATLGVSGLPQSGTGQAALLTGENAPALYGRHFGPWVPARLRPLVTEGSFLAKAQARGKHCDFANAYPKEYFDSRWARRPAAPPLAAMGAGILNRDGEALRKGEALSSEIVNTPWRRHLGYRHVPEISPGEAGRNLARISLKADLTFFAHYATDLAGHRGRMEGAVEALERVDAFLAGVLEDLTEDSLLVLASDHGNVEDVSVGHTTNPAFTLISGPEAARRSQGMERITDVPSLLLKALLDG